MKKYLKKIILFFIIHIIIFCGLNFSFNYNDKSSGYLPKDGFVPDKDTAIKIAEIIWLPIYGEKIYERKPFIANLRNDKIWIVHGSLEKNAVGGVPYIEIQKSDCKIIKVVHSK